ncbi:MAG: hypothetical protein A2X37_05220 [Elusimicrobia bacterium GWA2_66_18]|nr:MAG: hypothetical protein A2X37_05220 [Elusimicrobia bacterium GWA2_66_18]
MRYSETGSPGRERAAAFLAGAALSLVLLECGLRAAGWLVRRGARPPGTDGAWTVLCLGDSNTYTGGGYSYPDQLFRRLAAAGAPVRVVNRGVPGLNSTQLADMIDGELDRWRPDAVIVLIGADNFWNNLPIRAEPLAHRADRALLALRSWKLVKLLWVGIAEGSLRGRYRAGLAPRGREEALETVRRALDRILEHPDDWYRVQLDEAPVAPRVEAAVRFLGERLAAAPDDAEARDARGRWLLAQGDARGAAETFRGGAAAGACDARFFAGLAQALDRLEGEKAAAASLAAGDGACRSERRLAEAEWRLWRGDAAAAARIARAGLREKRVEPDAWWRLLGWALYEMKDYDAAIAAFGELSKFTPERGNLDSDGLTHAWIRKWENRRARSPKAPPPRGALGELDYAWLMAGRYDRCAESSAAALRETPLNVSRFQLYALCLRKAGRFDEVERLAAEVPALKENLMYRYYAAQRLRRERLGRPLEQLQEEQFARDMERVAASARRRSAALILSSYPEEEYGPVRRAAEEGGLPYADMLPLFRARFKHRDEFLAPDRCHPNAKGFAVMAEEYERLLRALPGFPGGKT